MKSIEISYSDERISLNLPDNVVIKEIKRKAFNKKVKPLKSLLLHSFDNPIGKPSLSSLIRDVGSILVLIPDFTREGPTDEIVQTLTEYIEENAPLAKISFLLCSGTHRSMSVEEIQKHVGAQIYQKYHSSIFNHLFTSDDTLDFLGTTELGTPIYVNKLLSQNDFIISMGAVKPHRDAGWSGGAKMIQPGASGLITTGYTHWNATNYSVRYMLGNNDNPIREEIETIAKKTGLNFSINYLLNENHTLVEACSGDFVLAHRKICTIAEPYFTFKFSKPADLFICGSSPAQPSMWGNATGPNWSELVLKKRGKLILLAKCPDGICKEHPEVEEFGYLPKQKIAKLIDEDKINDLAAASHMHHGGEKIYGKKKIRCYLASDTITHEKAIGLNFHGYGQNPQELLDTVIASIKKSKIRIYYFSGYDFCEMICKQGRS